MPNGDIMTTDNDVDEHASAATNHGLAARHHREASNHFQFEKGWAHAAHQAFLARGYALHAMDHGIEAGKKYAERGHATSPSDASLKSPPPAAVLPRSAATTSLGDGGHHAAAAEHSEKAAYHHQQASKLYEAKDYSLAAQEAAIALGHAQSSIFHGEEAAKHHAEHYGKAGPTAEIA
jgi:hypothetical protein